MLPHTMGPAFDDVEGIDGRRRPTGGRFSFKRPSPFLLEALETPIIEARLVADRHRALSPSVDPKSTESRLRRQQSLLRSAHRRSTASSFKPYPERARRLGRHAARTGSTCSTKSASTRSTRSRPRRSVAVFTFTRHYQYIVVLNTRARRRCDRRTFDAALNCAIDRDADRPRRAQRPRRRRRQGRSGRSTGRSTPTCRRSSSTRSELRNLRAGRAKGSRLSASPASCRPTGRRAAGAGAEAAAAKRSASRCSSKKRRSDRASSNALRTGRLRGGVDRRHQRPDAAAAVSVLALERPVQLRRTSATRPSTPRSIAIRHAADDAAYTAGVAGVPAGDRRRPAGDFPGLERARARGQHAVRGASRRAGPRHPEHAAPLAAGGRGPARDEPQLTWRSRSGTSRRASR